MGWTSTNNRFSEPHIAFSNWKMLAHSRWSDDGVCIIWVLKKRDTLPRPNLQFGSIWNILGHHDQPWFLLENEQQTNTVKAKPTPADHNFQIISPCLIVSALFWKDFPRYSGETLTINVEIKKLWNLRSSGSKTLIHTCPILDGLQTMISSWLGKWWNKNSKCKSINPRFIHI